MVTNVHLFERTEKGRQGGKTAIALSFVLWVALACFGPSAFAQTRIGKIPGVNKNRTPHIRQNFTGVIRSLNKKRHLLTVRAVRGDDTEFFPLTRRVRISSANGKKLTWNVLTAGTSVMVSFEEHSGRRTVRDITVLEDQRSPAKKKGLLYF